MLVRLLLLLSAVAGPVLAGSWTPSPFSQAVIMGVSCSDSKTCFIAGGDNGVGANALLTQDGAQTFTMEPIAPAMMLLAVATASADAAVIAGLSILSGGTQYLKSDAAGFTNSSMIGVSMQTTQDAQVVNDDPNFFAITGQFEFFSSGNASINGVAFSQNGGASFSFSDVGGNPNVPARYGAFPSANVGFVASGTWPPNSKKYGRYLSRNIHLHHDASKQEAFVHLDLDHENDAAESGWAAAIFRSRDGFQTWEQVYSNDQFYFNQISCASEQLCFAVAENDQTGYGFRTQDGGDTWEQVLVAEGVSMMAAHVISEDEVYLGGGVLSQMGINGTIYHSVDGGDSFTVDYLSGYYLTGLSFPTSGAGYATAMNEEQTCNVLVYSA